MPEGTGRRITALAALTTALVSNGARGQQLPVSPLTTYELSVYGYVSGLGGHDIPYGAVYIGGDANVRPVGGAISRTSSNPTLYRRLVMTGSDQTTMSISFDGKFYKDGYPQY